MTDHGDTEFFPDANMHREAHPFAKSTAAQQILHSLGQAGLELLPRGERLFNEQETPKGFLYMNGTGFAHLGRVAAMTVNWSSRLLEQELFRNEEEDMMTKLKDIQVPEAQDSEAGRLLLAMLRASVLRDRQREEQMVDAPFYPPNYRETLANGTCHTAEASFARSLLMPKGSQEIVRIDNGAQQLPVLYRQLSHKTGLLLRDAQWQGIDVPAGSLFVQHGHVTNNSRAWAWYFGRPSAYSFPDAEANILFGKQNPDARQRFEQLCQEAQT